MLKSVEIVEVAPRDGLQNESTLLSTADKLGLIERAVLAGVRRIEVTSFVHPRLVPQMADAEQIVAGLPNRPDVSYSGLVVNEKGFERARAVGLGEVNFAFAVSETFNQRNQGSDVAKSLADWTRVAEAAHSHAMRVTVTLGAAFGCPFEGEVPTSRVVEIAAAAASADPTEIALADTVGVGAPSDVHERIRAVRDVVGDIPLRCHFHNTRNTGLANAYAAAEEGVAALDSSMGGIGGCPFAPAATGNIPTEDLVYMLDRMGVSSGLALETLLEGVPWLEERLGKTVPGMLAKAGIFPPN